MLIVCRSCCREMLLQLIPAMLGAVPGDSGDEGPLAGLAAGDFHAVMQERTSSHLFEVCALHCMPRDRPLLLSFLQCTLGVQQDN